MDSPLLSVVVPNRDQAPFIDVAMQSLLRQFADPSVMEVLLVDDGSVDGSGDMRRCHFVRSVIGNIYEPNWRQALQPRACPNANCICHIGYIHLPRLNQPAIYGDGLLARIRVSR